MTRENEVDEEKMRENAELNSCREHLEMDESPSSEETVTDVEKEETNVADGRKPARKRKSEVGASRARKKKTPSGPPPNKTKEVRRELPLDSSSSPDVRISDSHGARVVLVASGKGGTGKSTVTGNLAASLARKGYAVVVVDADSGLRSMDYIMGAERLVFSAGDVFNGVCAPARALVDTAAGARLLAAAPNGRQEDVEPAALVSLVESLCEEFDFVFIDCPPGFEKGFGSAVRSSTEGILVVTPENTSLRNSAMAAGVLEAFGVPFVVVGNRTGILSDGPLPSEIAELLSAPLLAEIPESPFRTEKEKKRARKTKEKAAHRIFSEGTPGRIAFDAMAEKFVALRPFRKKDFSDILKNRVESILGDGKSSPSKTNSDMSPGCGAVDVDCADSASENGKERRNAVSSDIPDSASSNGVPGVLSKTGEERRVPRKNDGRRENETCERTTGKKEQTVDGASRNGAFEGEKRGGTVFVPLLGASNRFGKGTTYANASEASVYEMKKTKRAKKSGGGFFHKIARAIRAAGRELGR